MNAKVDIAELKEMLELGGLTDAEQASIERQIAQAKGAVGDDDEDEVETEIAEEAAVEPSPVEPFAPTRSQLWIELAALNSAEEGSTGAERVAIQRERDRVFRELYPQ